MVERNSRMGFLGGAHVFPGGAVDAADRGPGMAERLSGWDDGAGRSMVGVADPARARGYLSAAVRELYEEAGILLARADDGRPVEVRDDGDERAQRLAGARDDVASGRLSFSELLGEWGLVLDVRELRLFGHWITPEREKKRFDTRFFLAPCPPDQHGAADERESTSGDWVTPAGALESYRAREIELVPPTIATLERLLPFDSVASILDAADPRTVEPVLPKICIDDCGVTILYPRDEDYVAGEAGPADPARSLDRLVLRDGLWERP